ncbi:MAG: hypothetical protein C0592_00340 [Marinilabiliales bacterium]|nr:MAG: hypothetical protein C0592_00340 [Marinilabiliales bacterium]
MRIPWRNKIIRFRARIIKNLLAMISLSVMFSACGGTGSENQNTVNEDSLKQAREQERLDSITRADSIASADSIARADSIAYEDSIKNAQNYVIPVNTVIPDVKPKYGPPPGYFPEDKPQTRYGVVYSQ